MFNRRIYLDYASLTPIDSRVLREIKAFSAPKYANPSSLYKEGVLAKKSLNQARKDVADFIHAHPDEIIFTSGGTESNCLAIQGIVNKSIKDGIKNPHIIISSIEHSSIIELANIMEKNGCELTVLSVDRSGIVFLEELKKSIKSNTVIVSIMTINNEIGSVQPIKDIAKIIRDFKIRSKVQDQNQISYPFFHTDAAQAVICEDINVEKLGVDLLTIDSSKLYGPRGTGCLFIKRNTPIQPVIYGGGQEFGMRSGTENIPSIMGFAKALNIINIEKSIGFTDKFSELRKIMIDGLKSIRPDIVINGANNHILNISIPSIDNEFFVFQLDAKGIACSTKSSCLRDEDESYVIKAIGGNSKTAIRFSFGRWTKKGDIKRVLKVISKILKV